MLRRPIAQPVSPACAKNLNPGEKCGLEPLLFENMPIFNIKIPLKRVKVNNAAGVLRQGHFDKAF